MAENIKKIQLRLKTVNQVAKITNAMKLVAMSKLQQFQRKRQELNEIAKYFEQFETEVFQVSKDLPVLAVCIASDLGLASLYNRTMERAMEDLKPEQVLWIGKQGFERVSKNSKLHIINNRRSSDHLELENLYDEIIGLMADFQIKIALPKMSGQAIQVQWRELNQQLLQTDLIVYEPNYEIANLRYQEFYLYMTLFEAYYQSKFSENLTRRVAMEEATDNANEMREKLTNRYNQLRQEEITQEIIELSSGVE